jgi:hypothetical protein
MNPLVDLLIARDFDGFSAAVAADHDALSDPAVFAALKEITAADPAAFAEVCEQLEVAARVDVARLKAAVEGTGSAADLVFAACLGDARKLEPDHDAGVAKLMATAAQGRLSDVQVDMLIKAIGKATKVGIKVLRQAWARALAVYVNAKRAAEAPEHERREAEAEAAAAREQEDERKRLEASCRDITNSPTLLADLETAVHAAGVVGEGAAIRGAYLAGTSRLLASKAISLLRRGAAASGKNVLFTTVFSFFPDEDVIHMSSGHESH